MTIEIIRNGNVPAMIDDEGSYISLIVAASPYISDTIIKENEKLKEQYIKIVNYILDRRNYSDIEFSPKCAVGLHEIIVNGAQYFEDVEYEILAHCNPENIFGYLKIDPLTGKEMLVVYIMNDYTPKMLAHLSSDVYETLQFGFYEEDFWGLIEHEYKDIIVTFGGINMKRRSKNQFKIFYRPGDVSVYPLIKNPHYKHEYDENPEYITSPELKFKGIHNNSVQEVMAMYNPKDNSIVSYEDDMVIRVLNKPFDFFENKNLANIYTFAKFERHRYKYGDNPLYQYPCDDEIQIDWDPYDNTEAPVRFTVESGKLYDNELESIIPLDHAANILNLFEDQLKELPKKYAKNEDQLELYNTDE